jgi:molybdate transport system substrate-binding protein
MRPAAWSAVAVLALTTHASLAADLRVYSSGAPAQVVQAIATTFSHAQGHRVSVTVATVAELTRSLATTPAPDVVILPAPVIGALARTGTFAGGSEVELARVGIGVAVRAGAPLPDISTEDAVRALLVAARSIVHSDPAGGGFAGAQVARVMARLGIADLVKPKTSYRFAIGGGTAAVARGEAEIGLYNVSEILADKGVALVGPLPASLQSYITFVGAVHAGGAAPDAARAFLRALVAPDARDAWTAAGFEPAAP